MFLELYGRSSVDSYISYRATGVMWITVSLVPLFFFVGDRMKVKMSVVRKGHEGYTGIFSIPALEKRHFFELVTVFFSDFFPVVDSDNAFSMYEGDEGVDGHRSSLSSLNSRSTDSDDILRRGASGSVDENDIPMQDTKKKKKSEALLSLYLSCIRRVMKTWARLTSCSLLQYHLMIPCGYQA